MNNQLVEQVGRIVEIYRKINVPFEKLCKCSEAIDSMTEQKELSLLQLPFYYRQEYLFDLDTITLQQG